MSSRETVLKWWNELPSTIKLNYWYIYQHSSFTPSHGPEELTGREVERLYNAFKTLNNN